jgi:hypothetical protein
MTAARDDARRLVHEVPYTRCFRMKLDALALFSKLRENARIGPLTWVLHACPREHQASDDWRWCTRVYGSPDVSVV